VKQQNSHCKQQGVALITALLVVSIVAIVATSMLHRKNIEIRRHSNLMYWSQAYQYALGVEGWGMQILLRDLNSDGNKDVLNEDWATLLPPIIVKGGTVSGHIEDLQGRFNLNNLEWSDTAEKLEQDFKFQQFRRLIEEMGEDPDIAYAVVDWIDNDLSGAPQGSMGAEDDYYLGEDPPYRAANRRFTSPSELRLVRGVSSKLYEKLMPLITALPQTDTTLNVNTAKPELLTSLGRTFDKDKVKVIEKKQQVGFKSVGYFSGQEVPSENISIASDYFMIRSRVKVANVLLNLSSIVYRQGGEVLLLYRSLNSP
jgi:general secretion pathway protein K